METATELSRDCEAVQIPIGNTVVLPAGTPIQISQNLGGSLTVHALGGLFRINQKDLDALGIESIAASAPELKGGSSEALDEKALWDILKTCYDPEIPVNIVDLGLVYDLNLQPLSSGGKKVSVKMTLTAPGCGMGGTIARDAQEKLLCLPGIEEAEVEIVWDPPWSQAMITPQGRAQLGLD